MMSLWSWVRALSKAKEKGKGHAITVPMSGDHQRGGTWRGGSHNFFSGFESANCAEMSGAEFLFMLFSF